MELVTQNYVLSLFKSNDLFWSNDQKYKKQK